MYRLGDKWAAVREIQKYLHFVSDRITDEVPRISIDGFFGEETKAAVKAFQKYKGIRESGEVDYETFTLLYEDFLGARFLYNAEKYAIDNTLFPFKLGDTGNEVLLLNLMIDEITKIFKDVTPVDVKPYFSKATESAVKDIRKIFMLNGDLEIDLLLYDRMKYELLLRGNDKGPDNLF